jgi:hypothetical protein
MPDIIDTANNVTGHLRALKNAGVHTVIRYDDRMKAGDWKQIHTAEAKAIANTGLMLGIVYEHGAKPSGEKQGYRDAAYSRRMTQTRGQPSGSAVYFAVDHDASRSEIRNDILPSLKVSTAHLVKHLTCPICESAPIVRAWSQKHCAKPILTFSSGLPARLALPVHAFGLATSCMIYGKRNATCSFPAWTAISIAPTDLIGVLSCLGVKPRSHFNTARDFMGCCGLLIVVV